MTNNLSSAAVDEDAAVTASPYSFDGGDAKSTEQLLKVSDFIAALVVDQGWTFVYRDLDVDVSQIADPRGLMGVLLWEAEKSVRVAFNGDATEAVPGSTLGLQFTPDEEAAVGASPVLNGEAGSPQSPALVFVLDALAQSMIRYEIAPGVASLDHLVEAFQIDRDAGILPWSGGSAPRLSEIAPS